MVIRRHRVPNPQYVMYVLELTKLPKGAWAKNWWMGPTEKMLNTLCCLLGFYFVILIIASCYLSKMDICFKQWKRQNRERKGRKNSYDFFSEGANNIYYIISKCVCRCVHVCLCLCVEKQNLSILSGYIHFDVPVPCSSNNGHFSSRWL